MRITKIEVDRFRNLGSLSIAPDASSQVLCLVGANGTGKTNLLELIGFAAHFLGLRHDIPQLRRTMPPPEGATAAVTVDVSDLVSREMLPSSPGGPVVPEAVEAWDGHLTVAVAPGPAGGATYYPHPVAQRIQLNAAGDYLDVTLQSGGVEEAGQSFYLAQQVVAALRLSPAIHHLHIDADRVFPAFAAADDQILALARQPQAPEVLKQQAASITANLYGEWVRSLLADQQREAWNLRREAMDARSRSEDFMPTPQDPMQRYRDALQQVMPHLRFERVDDESRALVFDSAGRSLTYEQLSGGEREVAFLVGQVERFGVDRGLLVIDEPELHLNADLLRQWMRYLGSRMTDGQAWIATHSLEVAEVAGLQSTFVMERGDDRQVRNVQELGDRPALAVLAGALGTPALSLSDKRFVFIEGERPKREGERMRLALGLSDDVRLIEAGGCEHVLEQFRRSRDLAVAADGLRLGALIDRDHRSDDVTAGISDEGAYVLEVFEVENLYLDPGTLGVLYSQALPLEKTLLEVLQEAASPWAGREVLTHAVATAGWKEVPGGAVGASRQTWGEIDADVAGFASRVVAEFPGLSRVESLQHQQEIRNAVSWWQELMLTVEALATGGPGKEMLPTVASLLGFSGGEELERRAVALWDVGTAPRPPAALEAAAYVEALAPLQ